MGSLAPAPVLHIWNDSVSNSNLGLYDSDTLRNNPIHWVYNNTGGSILAMMLFHTMNNLSFFIFPTLETALGGLYLLILNILFAAAIVLIWGI
jgi:hypothetical protein